MGTASHDYMLAVLKKTQLTMVNWKNLTLQYTLPMNTESHSQHSLFKRFKKPGKHMFWAWIAYQTIKGTLTTSLIWIPLIWAWVY
jgi:hypothetical protein